MRAARQTWWVWVRFESWLSSMAERSAPVVFGGFLVWFVGWSLLAGFVFEAVFDEADRDAVTTAAGQLIPAAGVLFALLTAFVITNQWNRSRSAEAVVGAEADAVVRLALASESPGIDGPRVRRLLVEYLDEVLRSEWDTLRHERAGSPRTAAALARLERRLRSDATGPGVADAVAADALSSATSVAVARRDRLNLAGHGLPAPLFLLAFVSGVVLCLDAVAVVISPVAWESLFIGALVVLIALDLALVVAISDPFRGPMRVMPEPLESVRAEIEAGVFGTVDGEPPPERG